MKQASELFSSSRRFSAVLLAVCMFSAAFLAGCAGQAAGSSSTNSSSVSSGTSSPSASGSPEAAAQSSFAVTAASSSVSDGGYVISASSGGSGNSSGANSVVSRETDSISAPQAQSSGAEDSQPLFRSFPSSTPESGKTPAAADGSGPNISAGEYEQIQEGMTYSEAAAVIGGGGKLQREFGEQKSPLYTETYRWPGTASGSYADLTFEGGKLSFKIQMGLQ